MKIVSLLLLMPLLLMAKVHYAKVEPYESVILKSAVSGLVVDVKYLLEGKRVISESVVSIDDKLDRVDLNQSKTNLVLLKEMFSLNQEIAKTLKKTMQQQESYYHRIFKLTTASKTQKDNAYSAFASAKTQYLSTKEKMISLQRQIADIQVKVAKLEDTIDKKSLFLKDKYLYKLLVRVGDYVSPGTPLARVDDVSRAKLVLFLEPEELENLESKTIYFDGKKTTYKVEKVWKVADEKFISLYRTEIVIPAPEDIFSRLIKIEIK